MWTYLVRRVKSIFPALFIASVISYFLLCWAHDYDSFNRIQLFRYAINDFFYLQSIGYPVASLTGIIWYLSSMFVAIIVLYPIIRKYRYVYLYYIAPVLSVLLYGLLIKVYGTLDCPANYIFDVFNTGNIRALSGMMAGALVYSFSGKLKKSTSERSSVLLTIVEVASYIASILLIHIRESENCSIFDEQVVVLFIIGLSVTLSGKSLLGKIFKDNSICRLLGALSSVIFVVHFPWVQNTDKIFEHIGVRYDPVCEKYIAILISLVLSCIIFAVCKCFSGRKALKTADKA